MSNSAGWACTVPSLSPPHCRRRDSGLILLLLCMPCAPSAPPCGAGGSGRTAWGPRARGEGSGRRTRAVDAAADGADGCGPRGRGRCASRSSALRRGVRRLGPRRGPAAVERVRCRRWPVVVLFGWPSEGPRTHEVLGGAVVTGEVVLIDRRSPAAARTGRAPAPRPVPRGGCRVLRLRRGRGAAGIRLGTQPRSAICLPRSSSAPFGCWRPRSNRRCARCAFSGRPAVAK